MHVDTAMGVAKGGSGGPRTPHPQSSSHNFFIKDEVVYSTVRSVQCIVCSMLFIHIRDGDLENMALASSRGQLTMSLGFKSLVLASDYQSLAFALGAKSRSWPWPWAISLWPWPRTASPWPWKVSLTLAWSIKISGNQPSTRFHCHKCQAVLRFRS